MFIQFLLPEQDSIETFGLDDFINSRKTEMLWISQMVLLMFC